MRKLALAILVSLAVAVTPLTARAGEAVDLLLVLAADVSRSVDQPKFQLISAGVHRRIAVCFVEWSGVGAQKLVIDWMMIDGPETARKFADAVVEAPRTFADRTSISGAVEFSMAQLSRAPFDSSRRAIDVSGDGTNNSGRSIAEVRDEAVAQGITINGLVILSERPLAWNPEHTNPAGGLPLYYRENVIGGPGAFVIVAENFRSFGQALINKLVAEIAGRPPRGTTLARTD
jgi:hypothetical protein